MTIVRSRAMRASIALALMATPLVASRTQAAPLTPAPSQAICDPIDPAACLLPFPNDFFTATDATTDTGLRINFTPDAMPRTGTEVTEGGEGKPADPTEWNRNDGWSPGSMVMTYVPGIDLHQTWGTADRPHSEVGVNELGYYDHRDHIADIGLYANENAPMVIINTQTGERHPFWSELDSHRGAVDADERVLIMRPAINFTEGTRYVVALRDLKTADGSVIPANPAFAAIRDNTPFLVPVTPEVARREHFEADIFPVLEDAGIARDNLYLAWDFTVASERNLAERALHIRDDAFAQLGDTNLENRLVEGDSPEFSIDGSDEDVESWTDSNGVAHTMTVREVAGRVVVPNYLDRIQQTSGHTDDDPAPADLPAPLSRFFHSDLDGLPDQNPVESTVRVPFLCKVVVDKDGQPGGERLPMLYGHGLLGERGQVGDLLKSPMKSGPFMGCALDWWGMSFPDAPTVVAILMDIGNFPSLADRAQQGFLNFMYAGRALVHPDGFASAPEFQGADGQSLIETADEEGEPSRLHYDGNSQGGIMGGALTALSPDIHRSILGVPGINYSTLLNRSVDWEGELALEPEIPAYSVPYYENYRDPIERQIGFSLIQMLWDRGEGNGFAAHMTSDPYTNTPPHEVLLQAAFSDHQVANVAAEVEARTIGAAMMPGLESGRHWALDPFMDVAEYPYTGSALVYWDSGNATPPNGNVPPSQGSDPHGHPRSEPASGWQEAHFLLTGELWDVCNGGFYNTDNNPTNGGAPSCHEPTWEPGTYPPAPEEAI